PNTTKPQQTQAQEATPPRPHRKPPSARSTASASNPPDRTFPAERRSAVMERRVRMVELDRMPRREQVYRQEYSWAEDAPFVERRARPYPPPPFYGEPPTIGTFAKVRYSAARVSSMPPVGQNATPGKTGANALSHAAPPSASAGKNFMTQMPRARAAITSDGVATPGR